MYYYATGLATIWIGKTPPERNVTNILWLKFDPNKGEDDKFKLLAFEDKHNKWVPFNSAVDYDRLINKPKINNITLTGNKSWSDLEIDPYIASLVDPKFDALDLVGKSYLVENVKAGEIFGDYLTNQAVGSYSTAFGTYTRALGKYSLASGDHSQSWGDSSAVFGEGLRARNIGEVVVGRWNLTSTPNTMFTVGGGEHDLQRRNLFSINNTGEINLWHNEQYTTFADVLKTKTSIPFSNHSSVVPSRDYTIGQIYMDLSDTYGDARVHMLTPIPNFNLNTWTELVTEPHLSSRLQDIENKISSVESTKVTIHYLYNKPTLTPEEMAINLKSVRSVVEDPLHNNLKIITPRTSYSNMTSTEATVYEIGNGTYEVNFTILNDAGRISTVVLRVSNVGDVSIKLHTYLLSEQQIENSLTNANVNRALSAYQGVLLKTYVDQKIPKSYIVNNLESLTPERVLSANQGRILKELIDGLNQIVLRKVNVLPSVGVSNIIYLIPKLSTQDKNYFDEFLWIDNTWEHIGDTKVDLSDYATKSDLSMVESVVNTHTTEFNIVHEYIQTNKDEISRTQERVLNIENTSIPNLQAQIDTLEDKSGTDLHDFTNNPVNGDHDTVYLKMSDLKFTFAEDIFILDGGNPAENEWL